MSEVNRAVSNPGPILATMDVKREGKPDGVYILRQGDQGDVLETPSGSSFEELQEVRDMCALFLLATDRQRMRLGEKDQKSLSLSS